VSCVKPEFWLLCLQGPNTCSHPEPNKSCQNLPPYFIRYFNIIPNCLWPLYFLPELSPWRPGVDSRLFHVRILVGSVTLGQVFLRVLRVSPVNIIPPVIQTFLHLHVFLIRRTNGRSLGTLQRAMIFRESWSLRKKITFTCLLVFEVLTSLSTIIQYNVWIHAYCVGCNLIRCVDYREVDFVWNVMAHAQKPDFVFRRNGWVHLNRRGRQFCRLQAAEVCASSVVMLDTPCSEVVWRVLATHSIRQFPLHFPSLTSPCAITFQMDSITRSGLNSSVIKGHGQGTVTDIRDVRIITTQLETCSSLHVDGM
jgi:hypothetical protein